MDALGQVLHILIDYDNVDPMLRRNGIDHVLHRILDVAASALGDAMPGRTLMLLYGGWYEGDRLTRKAQDIVANPRYFASPVPRCPTGFPAERAVRVQAQLARTLLSKSGDMDSEPFTHTMRTRPVSTIGLRTVFPDHARCDADPCFLTWLGNFFRTGTCQVSPRRPDISKCALRDEKKLVDVMLATDLLFLAQSARVTAAVLVSSDDDLWPAIQQATSHLQTLVHIHTNTSGERARYERLVDRNHYRKCSLF